MLSCLFYEFTNFRGKLVLAKISCHTVAQIYNYKRAVTSLPVCTVENLRRASLQQTQLSCMAYVYQGPGCQLPRQPKASTQCEFGMLLKAVKNVSS